jgi:RecA-family ATPase
VDPNEKPPVVVHTTGGYRKRRDYSADDALTVAGWQSKSSANRQNNSRSPRASGATACSVSPFRTEMMDGILGSDPRSLPENVDVEQALLGALMISNKLFDKIVGICSAQDFANAMHARLFTQIVVLISTGKPANPVTLESFAETDNVLKASGGGKYLVQLAERGAVLDRAAALHYATVVANLAKRRAWIYALQDGLEQAFSADHNESFSDLLARAKSTMDELARDAPDGLALFDPRDLTGQPIPQREWIVRDWIPMRRATGIYAPPGTGKTLLMQLLCTAAAIRKPWLGLPVRPCESVLLYCEDDLDEMHERQDAINRFYDVTFDDLGSMRWLPRLGRDNAMMTFAKGHGTTTPLFHNVLAEVKAFGAQLVIFDTLSDVFAGSEIDRNQARQFVQQCPAHMAREIAGSVVCCAHPSLTGMNSASGNSGNSGSTAWPAAFRSHLYMEVPKVEDAKEPDGNGGDRRILTRKKSNWAKTGETIEMHWKDGVLVADQSPGGIIGSINRRACERVFLDLLDKTKEEGRRVSDKSSAGNYAPRVFAQRLDRERYTQGDFRIAMERAFIAREIKVVPYGPASDATTHIVRLNGTE